MDNIREAFKVFGAMEARGEREDLWLYFIQVGDDGPIKVGKARDPRDRLKTLQQGNPNELRLLVAFRGGSDDELALHALLGAQRLSGEWFAPEPPVIDVALALGFVADEFLGDAEAVLRFAGCA